MQKLFKQLNTFSLYDYAKPTPCEASHIVSLLRPMDYRELGEMYDGSAVLGLIDSINRSLHTYLIYDKHHRIAGIVGMELVSGQGFPWFLSTIYFPEVAKEFSSWAKEELMQYSNIPLLNFVHCDYTVALRWLRWLGFTVNEGERFFDDKFYLLYKESK